MDQFKLRKDSPRQMLEVLYSMQSKESDFTSVKKNRGIFVAKTFPAPVALWCESDVWDRVQEG
jgi:hypothetical protein